MTTARKPGRRPGDPEVTKRAILAAAREVFGEVGFERATMRAIARRADVDPALIHHHFGPKQRLFAAAHELPSNPEALIGSVAMLPRDEVAEAVVRVYVQVLGAKTSPLLSLIRAATTEESAARMLREYIDSILIENAHKLCPYPDAKLRVTLMGSSMIGVVFALRILSLDELTSRSEEDLVAVLAPVADRYLNAPDLTKA